MKASITLDDYARHGIEYMEIGCEKCGRNGRYAIARLIEKYGRHMDILWVVDAVATDCPKRSSPSIYDRCLARPLNAPRI